MSKILSVSESAALAMHAAVMMAAKPDGPLTTAAMAGQLRGSEATLSKVLQRLGSAGLVRSTPGPRGGHALAVSPERTTLLQIYEAVDGPLDGNGCLFELPVCGGECILGGLLREVSEKIRDKLSKAKLSELAQVYGSVAEGGRPDA
jgi:Rrf2 family protein